MDQLNTETTAFLLEKGFEYGTSILFAVIVFAVGWVVSKWASAGVLRAGRLRKIDEALVRFLSGLAQYAVLAFTVIAALSKVGIETTSMVAVLGSAGLAIGLALQGTLGHFASGVLILFFRPFSIGDVVTAAGQIGVVKDIGLFATTLTTPDNQTHIIPNGSVVGGVITNITGAGTRRATVSFGVAYGSDIAQVAELATAAAKSCPAVLKVPEPDVLFVNLGASSLDFNVNVWSAAVDFIIVQHQVRRAVYEALNAAEIEIPFNQIVVHQAG